MEYNGDAIPDSEWYEAEDIEQIKEKSRIRNRWREILEPSDVNIRCPVCTHNFNTDDVQNEYHPKNEQRLFAKCPGCKRWIEFDANGFIGEY